MRRHNLVPIAIGAALSVALAACGGGGSGSGAKSVVPAATSTAAAKAQNASATLTLKFPAHTARVKIGGATAAMKRNPAYINPNGGSLVVTAFGQTLVDPTNGNAGYFSLGTPDPTTGIVSIDIPLLSGNYNDGDLAITEYDGSGCCSVLAYGYNAQFTDSNGNFNPGSFSLSPGGSATPTVTMVMNATGIALTSDPVAGSDATALSNSSPGNVVCTWGNGMTLYAFPIDASGTFVVPGQGAGLVGKDPNSPFPGVNAATLSSQSQFTPPVNLTSTVFGPSVNIFNDPSGVGRLDAQFTTTNPLGSISNPYGYYTYNNTIQGYIELGGGFC